MTLHPRLLVLVVTAGLIAGALPLRAQSLADVARQEEARRKALKDGVKTYTNQDLKEVPPAPSTSAASPSTEPETSTDKSSTAKGQDGAPAAQDKDKAKDKEPVVKDQAYWGGRMKAVNDALDRDQTYSEALQTRINALSADFVNRDDPAQRAKVAQDRDKAVAELERLKKTLVDDKQAIDDLQEEARRASVPPGWLR